MTTPQQETPELLAWAQFQVAAMIYDSERTPRTWIARQNTYHQWASLFLADEGEAA